MPTVSRVLVRLVRIVYSNRDEHADSGEVEQTAQRQTEDVAFIRKFRCILLDGVAFTRKHVSSNTVLVSAVGDFHQNSACWVAPAGSLQLDFRRDRELALVRFPSSSAPTAATTMSSKSASLHSPGMGTR